MSEQPAGPAVLPESRPLAADVFLTLATKVSLLVLNIVATVVVARELGASGRGAVAVAFSFTLLLIQLGSLGMITANPYFAARDPSRIGRIVANAIWFALGLGAVLVLVGIGIKAFFPAALRGLDWLEVGVVLSGVPIAFATQLLQSVLLAEGRMKAYNGVELAMAVLLVIGLALGLGAFGFGVVGALAYMVILNVFGMVSYLLLLRRHGPPMSRPDLSLAKRMLKYGFRVYVVTVLAYLVGRTNLVLVNSYLGSSAAGVFSISVALSDGMQLFPSVVALNLFPRIARGGPFEQTATVFRAVTTIFALFCLITVPLAGPVIGALYGDQFTGATEIYYWMLPGIFAYGTLNVLSYHFSARGFPLEAVVIWIPGILINVGIIVLFMPGADAWVAALASTIAYFMILVLHLRLFAKEAGGYRLLVPRPRETFSLVIDALRSLRPAASG